MADLDPATLEKFQRFQAMLAESPEIVEALNSPEILALAAKTAAEKKLKQGQPQQGQPQELQQQPAPTPMPPQPPKPPPSAPVNQYPIVGHGISDDISVLSEMTTPTVMTRQTVEEDEFYPEVDGAGKSSSGMFGGPRRIGLKIGVSSSDDGRLPPPPPKSKARQLRQGLVPRKNRVFAATPMSKITETHDATSVDHSKGSTDEEPDIPKPPSRTGASWSPSDRSHKKEGGEAHPYFGNVAVGTVPRPARQSTYNTRNRRIKGRGVNRNRSAPNSLQKMSVSSMSVSSTTEGDESTFMSLTNNSSTTGGESESTATEGNQQTPTSQKVRSKASMSTPKERGVIRNRSMPLRNDGTSTNTSTEEALKVVDGSVVSGSLSDGDEETITEKASTTEKSSLGEDGRESLQGTGEKTLRTRNGPRMRLVPVVSKSEASSARLTPGSSLEPRKPRSRSLSKYSNRSLRGNISSSDEDDNVSRSSAPGSSKSLTQKRRPRRTFSKSSSNSLTGNSSSDDDDDEAFATAAAPNAASSKSLTQQRQPRSRSLSKFSNRNIRDSKSDTDDDVSRTSAPVKSLSMSSTESGQPKKPRSRSLSKYANIRDRLRGDNSSDDDDNVSRSSAPAVSSTDSGKGPLRTPKRMPSLTTDDDDCSQPSLPRRVLNGNDECDKGFTSNLSSDAEESDDINSLGNDSDDSSSEDEKEKRPPVVRRWKPPVVDNSNLPPAFRFSSSSSSLKMSNSNHSGKLSGSNHSGKLSRSNHSQKSSESKTLKKGRKPAPRGRSMSYTKSSSEEEMETRTEERNNTSSSDNEEAYVRQTVRKPGKPKKETEESPPQNPEQFEQHFAELTQVIESNTARPSDYIGADGAFGANRRRRGQPRKKTLDRSTTSAPRETDWLGAGGPKKRTWKVKSVKEVS